MSSRLEKRQHNTAQPGHKSLRNKNANRRKSFSLLQCKKQRSTKFLQNRKACMYQENKKIILYLYNLDIFPLRIVLRVRSKDRHLYICLCLRNPPPTHPSETTNQIAKYVGLDLGVPQDLHWQKKKVFACVAQCGT